jgi:hypothetical protein
MRSAHFVSQVLKRSLVILTTFSGVLVLAQSAPPTAASTTSTATVVPAATKKFALTLANETTNSIDTAVKKGGAVTVNVISATYQAQENIKVGATLVSDFTFVGRGEDQSKQENTFRDLSLSAATTHAGILGAATTPVKYYFNLPTSDKSKADKQAFLVAADISLGYELTSNLAASVLVRPGWYSINGKSDMLRNYTAAELRYAHTSKFSSYGVLDHRVRIKTETSLPKELEEAHLGVGVGYSPNQVIDLDFNVSRDRALLNSGGINPSREFAFFDAKEISYTAGATLKF